MKLEERVALGALLLDEEWPNWASESCRTYPGLNPVIETMMTGLLSMMLPRSYKKGLLGVDPVFFGFCGGDQWTRFYICWDQEVKKRQ